MRTKRFLILALCIFILGTFISACGGGGKSTPPSYPFIPVPTPTPTVSPSPDPTVSPTPTPTVSPTPVPPPTVSPTPAKYPIELSQTEFTVNVGETDNIIVTLNGEDITQTATYTVDQEAIATVEGGLITGISAGFATVTVNAENAESEKTFTVNVIDPSLPTLEVSQTEFNLWVGDEDNITVTLNGEPVTDQVTYTSDEESIATAEKGRIEAKNEGTAKITVSLEGANSASFTVNVKEPIPVTLDGTVLDELHELKIIANSYADRQQLKEIDIPAIFTYKGTKYKIISIGEYGLFSNCTSLKKVTLPDSLETITQSVFENCSSLEEMTIRDDVVCIFPSAFLNCSNLTKLTTKSGKEINIPTNDVETVENVTFIGVKLEPDSQGYSTITSITIPNGLTEIPSMAFNNCRLLPNITIPKSVKTIGEGAFSHCNSLTELIIPDDSSLTTIGGNAFYECIYYNLSIDISSCSNITSIGQNAFYCVNNIKISEAQKTLDNYPWGALNVNAQDSY